VIVYYTSVWRSLNKHTNVKVRLHRIRCGTVRCSTACDTWWLAMRRLTVANGPNIFHMLLVTICRPYPPQSCHFRWASSTPVYVEHPWTHLTQHPRRHSDPVSRFSTNHRTDRPTDRPTDRRTDTDSVHGNGQRRGLIIHNSSKYALMSLYNYQKILDS